MLLQRHPGDAALAERLQRVCHALERRRDHIFGALRVHVAPLEPDLPLIGVQAFELLGRGRGPRGRVDQSAGKREAGLP